MDYHFYLKEQWTSWLFWLGYLAVIFSKINKVGLFLQGKQLIVFMTNDKIWAFKHFGELYIWHCEFDSFPILKYFSDEIRTVMNVILEDLHNLVTNIFWMVQNHPWVKDPLKVQDTLCCIYCKDEGHSQYTVDIPKKCGHHSEGTENYCERPQRHPEEVTSM